MEAILKKQPHAMQRSKPSSSPLAMHKQSYTISKPRPKIRIIHVFAPEIIKTDVENFRELVQRLTGKPDHDHRLQPPRDKKPGEEVHQEMIKVGSTESKPRAGKEEEEGEVVIWPGGESSSGGYLNVFPEFDGLIPGFEEFPFLPLDANPTSMHMGSIGDHQLLHHHHQQQQQQLV